VPSRNGSVAEAADGKHKISRAPVPGLAAAVVLLVAAVAVLLLKAEATLVVFAPPATARAPAALIVVVVAAAGVVELVPFVVLPVAVDPPVLSDVLVALVLIPSIVAPLPAVPADPAPEPLLAVLGVVTTVTVGVLVSVPPEVTVVDGLVVLEAIGVDCDTVGTATAPVPT
jgi:hypothetical protein